MTEPAGSFEIMSQELWLPGKCTKPDRIIQLNWGEEHTHASYKITMRNFNIWETKMILLSDELWLIAINTKSFANESTSIIRKNLGFCKHSKAGVLLWILQIFSRAAFYIEQLWQLIQNSNLMLAMQILTKKRSYCYILIIAMQPTFPN